MLVRRAWLLEFVAAVAIAVASLGRPALAHPHVFVVATATVNIEHDAITSIAHTWAFDEFYTAMALEGIAKNKDGGYGRAELAELAKVNVDGLKEFGYFTFATLGKTEVKVGEPKEGDYWLDYTGGALSLHFTVPLEKPVPISAKEFSKGFSVVITDPSYFIAFELSDKDPPKLNADAPKTCKVAVDVPKEETASADEKRLTGAFAQQMVPAPTGMGGVAKAIQVSCGG